MVEYLASLTATELAPILTILAGMLLGFYKLMQYILEQHAKTQESDRNERIELSHAINRMAKASEKAAEEAEKRNGHLAELTIEARADVLTAINHIRKQEVKEQVVQHQTIEKE